MAVRQRTTNVMMKLSIDWGREREKKREREGGGAECELTLLLVCSDV